MTQPGPGLNDWRRAYLQVQRVTDRQILELLRQATRQINADIKRAQKLGAGTVSEGIRIQQMRMIRDGILARQAELYRKLGEVIAARRLEAARRASSLGSDLDDLLLQLGKRGAEAAALREALTRGLTTQTVEAAVVRMTQSRFPLSERIYRSRLWADGVIDRRITSALARGLTAREFAAEAEGWFNPNTPGGARYAAMRLARTEINNAYHAIAVNQAAGKPWVTGMKWHLSGSHPRADRCDELANQDRFNLGAGVFPPRDVPAKPHPQCLCVVTPVVMDEDEFLDQLVSGRFDQHLGVAGEPKLPPGRVSSVPSRPARTTRPKTTKTPEQREREALQRSAAKHAKGTVKLPTGPGTEAPRTKITGELVAQSKVTPRSMLRLRRVEADRYGTPYGRAWSAENGKNTGALYRYTGSLRDVNISPAIFDDLASYEAGFTHTPVPRGLAGHPWHVPSDRPGLPSVIAHEYGHHLDALITRSTGNFSESIADQFFPALSRALGIADQPLRQTWSKTVTWQSFDDWVKSHKTRIASRVSQYGATNGREIIAEIWCEYTTAKSPRPWIIEIGRLLQRLAEEASR